MELFTESSYLKQLFAILYCLQLQIGIAKASLTPTSINNVCPGDMRAVECTVTGAVLQWRLPNPLGGMNAHDRSFSAFLHQNLVGTRLNVSGDTLYAYTVVLDSIDMNPTRLTSTLEVTLFSSLDGQTIECSGSSVGIAFYDLPPSPLNPRIVQTIFGTESTMVTIQWDPPQISGAVDNYTVSITPEPVSGDSISTLTRAQVDFVLNYNVPYSVEVVASNCVGTSESPSSFNFTLVRCNTPTAPLNGQLGSISGRSEGSIVTFMCDEGFTPPESIPSECMADMTWNPDPGSFVCVPIPTDPPILCGLPQSPVDGSLGSHLPSSPLGTTVTFQCDDGLFPTDVRTATCRDMSGRGEWEPNPAQLVCRERPVNCSLPAEPRNGTILGYDNFNVTVIEGTMLTFQCDPGFLLNGEMTITCTNAGEWSTDPVGLECNNVSPFSIAPLSTGAAVGVSVVVTFIVTAITAFLAGVLVTYLIMRKKATFDPSVISTNPPPQEQPPPPGPVYEEVSTPKENIELETNLAYGPVRQ